MTVRIVSEPLSLHCQQIERKNHGVIACLRKFSWFVSTGKDLQWTGVMILTEKYERSKIGVRGRIQFGVLIPFTRIARAQPQPKIEFNPIVLLQKEGSSAKRTETRLDNGHRVNSGLQSY